jgi:hypothetical protein
MVSIGICGVRENRGGGGGFGRATGDPGAPGQSRLLAFQQVERYWTKPSVRWIRYALDTQGKFPYTPTSKKRLHIT